MTWTLQGLWVLFTAACALAIITAADRDDLGWVGYLGIAIWVIGFAIEVAEYAEQKTGRTVGVMAAKTGNRSGIMWATFAESLDQIMDDSQALETDPNWLEFFRRSEGLYVPGSLEDSIWQFMP